MNHKGRKRLPRLLYELYGVSLSCPAMKLCCLCLCLKTTRGLSPIDAALRSIGPYLDGDMEPCTLSFFLSGLSPGVSGRSEQGSMLREGARKCRFRRVMGFLPRLADGRRCKRKALTIPLTTQVQLAEDPQGVLCLPIPGARLYLTLLCGAYCA